METEQAKTGEKTIPELKKELDRATRMQAMVKAIGEKVLELQAENELLKERLAGMLGGTPEKPENEAPEKHTSLAPEFVFDCLAVTNVQVFPLKEPIKCVGMKALALATIVLNDQIQIRSLRVMDGENGLYVSYPTDPFYKGEDLRHVCWPFTRQLREHIENCVLEKYQAAVS